MLKLRMKLVEIFTRVVDQNADPSTERVPCLAERVDYLR